MKTIDLVLAALFAALMGIGANIASFLPEISGVPLTFQTIIAILAGAILGARVGSISMIVYTLIGLVGVPVFAKFSGGFGTIMDQSFGFILSFIILAYVVGKMVERSKKPKFGTFLVASFVGLVINYVVGTTYMYLSLNLWLSAPVSYTTAWGWMVPFLIKDVILTFIIAIIATRIYGSVQQSMERKGKRVA